MWDLSLAQPHFLHIPHSACDTDCSLKKVLLQCWTSMCKIYHGGVRNFNLCFQNRLAAWGPKWGVSEIPHSFLLFFFFLVESPSSLWVLHLFTGVHLSLHRCKDPQSWTRMPEVLEQMSLNFGEFLRASANRGNAWEKLKTGRSAGLCWLQRSQRRSSISWCKALEPWPSAQHVGMNASPESGGTSPVWVRFLWTQ